MRSDVSAIVSQINESVPLADMTHLEYLVNMRLEALPDPSKLVSHADSLISAWARARTHSSLFKYGKNPEAPGTLETLHEDLKRIAGENRRWHFWHIYGLSQA